MSFQLSLPLHYSPDSFSPVLLGLKKLGDHFELPEETLIERKLIEDIEVFYFTAEYWSSKQRQSNSLHEISYRACFKAELPRFFIRSLTKEHELVYDPFAGRGTTPIEAALLNRTPMANDINPLGRILCEPRFLVPTQQEIEDRLNAIPFHKGLKAEIDLTMFYEEHTESELVSLRNYLIERQEQKQEDQVDRWIRMVATNRLTGHSVGFFSVYTLPPNQACSQERQRTINQKREQLPEYRDVKKIILKKSASLTKEISKELKARLKAKRQMGMFLTGDSRHTPAIASNSIKLTVTSPPFLNVVNYQYDNWLRCWFNNISLPEDSQKPAHTGSVKRWGSLMKEVFEELYRVTTPGGWVAFEVGEVKKGKTNLDEVILPIGLGAGFRCKGILINQQSFTKTSHIWGVKNNGGGTNSNRIVLFYKDHSSSRS